MEAYENESIMERTYTIPLRREWRKTVRYRRAKKTIRAIREFLIKHMKAEDVKIGKHLNEEVWKNGIRNPPSKIRVNAFKDKEGIVITELFGKPLVKKKAEVKKKEGGIMDKLKEKVAVKDDKKDIKKPKKDDKQVEDKPEVKAEKKVDEKEEGKKVDEKPTEEKKKVTEKIVDSKPEVKEEKKVDEKTAVKTDEKKAEVKKADDKKEVKTEVKKTPNSN